LEELGTCQPETGDFPVPAEQSETAWRETLEKLENTHRELLISIEKLSDPVLKTKIVGKDYSYRFLLRETLNHKVYHSGQIALLKKAFL
jgi:hypothetical protein